MTQEDKKLLIKDLCARLPYDLIVRVSDINDHTYQRDGNLYNIKYLEGDYNGIPYLFDVDNQGCLCDIIEIKPYLRSIENMTKEENREYFSICTGSIRGDMIAKIDFYIKHHFDFRLTSEGLSMIEAGLALEAPDGMYK